jgi:hypothetical protein
MELLSEAHHARKAVDGRMYGRQRRAAGDVTRAPVSCDEGLSWMGPLRCTGVLELGQHGRSG